jgi:uncharacterized RDD family membrane protein YckC
VNAIAVPQAQASGPALDNRRVAAAVVDLAVIGLGGVLLRLAADGEFTPLLGAVTVAWGLLYYFACESAGGQTLGKRLLGLRVERVGGGPADDRAIALRTLLRLVDGLGLYVVGLVAMLASGERRQRLGDRVAATMVVSAGAASRSSLRPSKVTAVKAVKAAATAEEPAPEVPSEPLSAEPIPVEEPRHLFNFEPEPEPEPKDEADADPVEDDGPRMEIVSSGEDPGDSDVEPDPEELPAAAKAEEPEPVEPERAEPQAEAETEDAEAEPEQAPRAKERPRLASAALEELVDDVAATAGTKPSRESKEDRTPAAAEGPGGEEATEDESVSVKPVETVSPIDLVMSQDED